MIVGLPQCISKLVLDDYFHVDRSPSETTFNISVMHHRNYTVLSNMPVREKEVAGDDMLWTHFNTTPAMHTCFLAAIITNLFHDSSRNDSSKIETVNMRSREYSALHIICTKFCEKYYVVLGSQMESLKEIYFKSWSCCNPKFPRQKHGKFRPYSL